ncbi:tRNA (adenosine(37)-N6)-threonylcarbamoyltransferase complex ATPase subunit type 1 TsaE [Rothia sp. P6271]|uniref:tRNA (adenosine(37)-N6)-threonylcarbamoyltransferase complex ATPase subunit type 1 TsaE n=1 Tax=unclassified Rothia (in: high G+C Gram-positive bacteria) TaxID=2689056 RepID=UPI003AD233E3
MSVLCIEEQQLLEKIHHNICQQGAPKIITIDGRSGAGKTTFSHSLYTYLNQRNIPSQIFTLENLYQGWNGLQAGIKQWHRNLNNLSDNPQSPLIWFGWDWETQQPTGPHLTTIDPRQTLIVEGVGATPPHSYQAPFNVITCWLDMSSHHRKERALNRDGETYRPYWDTWAEQENLQLPAHPASHIDYIFSPPV